MLVFVCLANLGYLLLVKRVRDLRRFAAVQIYLDVLFAGCLVYLTGAGESNITVVYFACILAASTILGAADGVLVASLATVTVALMHTLTYLAWYYGWVLPLSMPTVPSGPVMGFYGLVAALMAHAIGYYLVAILAGRLARGLSGVRMLNDKILESIHDGVIALDGDRRVCAINRVAMRLMGLPVSNGYTGKLLDVVVSASAEAAVLREVFRGEQPAVSSVVLVSNDGASTPVAVTSSPMRDERARVVGLVVMLIDLTERKRLEEALAQIGRAHV